MERLGFNGPLIQSSNPESSPNKPAVLLLKTMYTDSTHYESKCSINHVGYMSRTINRKILNTYSNSQRIPLIILCSYTQHVELPTGKATYHNQLPIPLGQKEPRRHVLIPPRHKHQPFGNTTEPSPQVYFRGKNLNKMRPTTHTWLQNISTTPV